MLHFSGPSRLTILILDASLSPSSRLQDASLHKMVSIRYLYGFNGFSLVSGPMMLDEAISVAQTVSAGDAGAVLFTLLPIPHGSTDKDVVMKHRRVLEDKICQ